MADDLEALIERLVRAADREKLSLPAIATILEAAEALRKLKAERDEAGLYTEAHERLDNLAREKVTAAETSLALVTGELERAREAVRLALPILDDDLSSYRGDTPPARYDVRGFVCLDDLSCAHDRWKECEATLRAMAAIRDVLPAEEWVEETYATSQDAVEHFAPEALRPTLQAGGYNDSIDAPSNTTHEVSGPRCAPGEAG